MSGIEALYIFDEHKYVIDHPHHKMPTLTVAVHAYLSTHGMADHLLLRP